MRLHRPAGFGFLAICCFAFALLMAAFLADTARIGDLVVDRMIAGVTGALGLLAAEALWFVRRWAFRASLAFAGMFVMILLAMMHSSLAELAMVACLMVVIAIALKVVYQGLHAPSTIRIPAP
jgi:hypothetical protein